MVSAVGSLLTSSRTWMLSYFGNDEDVAESVHAVTPNGLELVEQAIDVLYGVDPSAHNPLASLLVLGDEHPTRLRQDVSMTITPDGKDWTWILERHCTECGFEASAFDVTTISDTLRANAAQWRDLLLSPDVSVRPRGDRWSTLEYACHVRDASRIYATRLERMLTEDGPHYANWDQDETAITDRYGEQSADRVAGELAVAADQLAARFDTVRGEQWQRNGFRSDGASFTVESFARYFIHDPIHHIWDVTG